MFEMKKKYKTWKANALEFMGLSTECVCVCVCVCVCARARARMYTCTCV
jgi:hypothetical protein